MIRNKVAITQTCSRQRVRVSGACTAWDGVQAPPGRMTDCNHGLPSTLAWHHCPM
ncbi:MAG: hypothetical protein PUH57_01075 [Prevotellaceae bacterium]|nr:hypothetical protein [Prevotella sp.]MDD7246726.1 hypothetical protein [Prevotellaceae bacterium]MDY2749705.1 hypothetical protein [Prevotella sp.]